MAPILLKDAYYTTETGSIPFTGVPIGYGLRYDPSTGDYELKQRGLAGSYDIGIGLATFYKNGSWTSDAIRDPKLFTNNDPSKPTALANQLSEDMRKKVNAAYLIGGGQNKGLKINPTAQNPTGTAGVQNYSPGTAPPVNVPGITTPPGQGNVLDAFLNPLGAIDKIAEEYASTPGDAILKSFKVLKYPSDILDSKQDILMIQQFRYSPPRKNIFDDPAKIITEGIQRLSAIQGPTLSTVILPIPNNLQDSNNVSWGPDNMNNLTAAVAGDVLANVPSTAGSAALGGILSGLLGTGVKNGAELGVKISIITKLLQQYGQGNKDNANALAGTAIGSQLLNMAGFEVSPESILANRAGLVPNSNIELLFNAPTLREF
jgi:hypothetical protein